MKRKIFTFLLSLCALVFMLAAAFPAAAADTPVYTVNVTATGKDIAVSVTLPGAAKAAGGNFTLQYAANKVTCTDTADSVEAAGFVVVNPAYAEDAVRASFAQAAAITEDTVLATINFEYTAGTLSAADFKLTEFTMFDDTAQTVIAQGTSGSVTNFTCDHGGQTTGTCSVCGAKGDALSAPLTDSITFDPVTSGSESAAGSEDAGSAANSANGAGSDGSGTDAQNAEDAAGASSAEQGDSILNDVFIPGTGITGQTMLIIGAAVLGVVIVVVVLVLVNRKKKDKNNK